MIIIIINIIITTIIMRGACGPLWACRPRGACRPLWAQQGPLSLILIMSMTIIMMMVIIISSIITIQSDGACGPSVPSRALVSLIIMLIHHHDHDHPPSSSP